MKERGASLALEASPGIKSEGTQGQGDAEASYPPPVSHGLTSDLAPAYLIGMKGASDVSARSTACEEFRLSSLRQICIDYFLCAGPVLSAGRTASCGRAQTEAPALWGCRLEGERIK